MSKNNVIDFRSRQRGSNKAQTQRTGSEAPVVDMTERRQEMISSERRQVRRTILTEFIGACVVIPRQGLMKVSIYDISETGVAFDLDPDMGAFHPGEELAMRVYMNYQTYFPFVIKIQNVRKLDDQGVIRMGANFLVDTINKQALFHFVRFIENVSASLERDSGDVMVSNLKK